MKQQQLESALKTIRDGVRQWQSNPVTSGTGVLLDLIASVCDEALSPSGGKVDAAVSNTASSRSAGSSPASGTTSCPCGKGNITTDASGLIDTCTSCGEEWA